MALSTVTLTWDLADLIQSGVNATITLVPTAVLTDTTDHIVIPQVTRSRVFTGGTGSLPGIIACDNGAISPAGWAYTITITLANGTVLLSISAFINFANGASQDLSTLTPLSSAPTLQSFTPPGRPATLIVAASNASAAWKNAADDVCTGSGDDVMINAAQAALPAQGGTVLLSDGQFNISGPLIPTINNTRLLGQGLNATTIKAATGANCNGYQFDATTQLYNLIFCCIEGITFDGNGNASGYGCRINYNLTHTFWDFYLRDVWFKNWGNDGFWSTGGHGYVLDHVLAELNGGGGINFTGGFIDSPPRILNGTVKLNTGSGILSACIDTLVQGNEISANSGSYGLVLSASGCKAIGNQIRVNAGSGVHVTGGAEGIALTGNTISNNALHGLLLDDAFCSITGNFFTGNSTGSAGASDEINVTRGTFNAVGNQIVGNIIDCASQSRYGINLAHSGDTGAVLAANQIVSAVTAPTNFVPTDTVVLNPGVIAAGGAKITGLGNGSAASDAAAFGQLPALTAADTSAVVGGTATAPTVRTGTVDVIAAQHPAAADWSNNSHKITSLLNGSGAQDAAAFGQIPVADATAGHILATGAQAAGANGKWADSGHVHPALTGGYQRMGTVVGWTCPSVLAQASQILTAAGVLFMFAIEIPAAATTSNFSMFVTTAGNTLANVFAALVDTSGNIQAQTANRSADAALTSNATMWTAPWSTPYAAPAGEYYGCLLIGSATTMPTFTATADRAASLTNIGCTAAAVTLRAATTGSSLSALPGSPITMSGINSSQHCLWAALT